MCYQLHHPGVATTSAYPNGRELKSLAELMAIEPLMAAFRAH